MKVYLGGSLRNPRIPEIANALELALNAGHDSLVLPPGDPHTVFSDWFGAGPKADDHWRDHERARGRTYEEAIRGPAAQNVLDFDRSHLDSADAFVLALPAGLSGGVELSRQFFGEKKPCAVLLDNPERWDVMIAWVPCISSSVETIAKYLLGAVGAEKPRAIRGPADPGYRGAGPVQRVHERAHVCVGTSGCAAWDCDRL